MYPLLLICLQLSVSAQNGTDIILFDAKVTKSAITLSNSVNITKHKGYDNQPFFYKKDIYYSSETDSGQMDIKKYNYKNKSTSVITHTVDNEFSPTVMPGGKFISCILQRKNGKQDLVKYRVNGGLAIVFIDNLKVGYHAWADDHSLLLFVLEDTATNALHYLDMSTKKDARLTDNIGRSIHRIPSENALSFIQKSADEWMIKKFTPATGVMSSITAALPHCEYLAWTHSGCILMSDGKDIYFKKAAGKNDWQKVVIHGNIELKKITRLAFNEDDTRMAIVVAE